ncbi:hypothetical protein RI543_003473 [Arxiozyma heterogenica]|uniref:non-specific serine/threonine protein kinase n=1 Tax=Arxiozyma heterogenica TaxID=278026 RepID=A0AAN7ZXQ2_9SACH|nr:hypothetical protein RI543_003473 [Kazachstania heterogenica]
MHRACGKSDTTLQPSKNTEILYEFKGFQYFSNGKHNHRINSISKINNPDCNKINISKFLNKNMRIFRLLRSYCKKFQTNNIENSVSLLPYSNFSSPEFLDSIPKVLDPNAFINVKQLQLIALLSERMKCDPHNYKDLVLFDQWKNIPSNNNKCIFKFRYGNLLSDIEQRGSSRHIMLFSKKKINEIDFENSHFTYCNDGNIFYAIKEFKNKNPEKSFESYRRGIISEFIIGNCFFGKCANIVNIFDIMEVNDSRYVQVMELCPSGDLYEYVKTYTKINKKIHVIEADCFMKQLLNGVSYMHTHGIAHCDIKLENILFYPNGLLKLCDFGNSTVFQTAWESNVHEEKTILGTQPYLAPEEFKKKPYDPRISDCWSCGMVYITMILGHYIWRKASLSEDLSFKKFHNEMERTGMFHIFEELTHIYPIKELTRKEALYRIFDQNPTSRITVLQLINTSWVKGINCCQD